MSILQFRPRRPQSALDGFFWCMPAAAQRARIRDLARARFAPERIAATCRMPLDEVLAILDADAAP